MPIPKGFKKPSVQFTGANGNVFNLIGLTSRALKKAGHRDLATEMVSRVTSCGSYDEALRIMMEYVDAR